MLSLKVSSSSLGFWMEQGVRNEVKEHRQDEERQDAVGAVGAENLEVRGHEDVLREDPVVEGDAVHAAVVPTMVV